MTTPFCVGLYFLNPPPKCKSNNTEMLQNLLVVYRVGQTSASQWCKKVSGVKLEWLWQFTTSVYYPEARRINKLSQGCFCLFNFPTLYTNDIPQHAPSYRCPHPGSLNLRSWQEVQHTNEIYGGYRHVLKPMLTPVNDNGMFSLQNRGEDTRKPPTQDNHHSLPRYKKTNYSLSGEGT